MTSYPKDQARQLVNERLSKKASGEFEESSRLVNHNLQTTLLELCKRREIKKALLYKALRKYHEVDISTLQSQFPAVRFDFAPSGSDSRFPEGSYDCIVVPLPGFNDKGYRLGHGGGWYDRFLLTQPEAYKIGVGLESGRIGFTPENHDIPMDCIITEATSKSPQAKN